MCIVSFDSACVLLRAKLYCMQVLPVCMYYVYLFYISVCSRGMKVWVFVMLFGVLSGEKKATENIYSSTALNSDFEVLFDISIFW